jgi:hypothetical protein
MDLSKYKNKYNILFVITDSYYNDNYIKIKELYDKNIKLFHKYKVKLLTKRNKNFNFFIKLYNFKNKKIKDYKSPNNYILKYIQKLEYPNNSNLSLYSDYNKFTSNKTLGFKNKEKAIYTINSIKNKSIKYQISVINTMLGRAKNHPHKTKEMDEAIKVFNKWIRNYKK